MSEQTNAELIATAKAMREQMGETPKPGSILALWFETADAPEAALHRAEEAEGHLRAQTEVFIENARELGRYRDERDALAAVIEKAEDYVTRHYLDTRFGAEVLPILTTTTPADALREHDAALIERLADGIRHRQHAESIRQWLREKARQRREEQS